jgi:hypothetical protein
MAEQPANLSTVLYLGVFSRAEQRVLQAIFNAIAQEAMMVPRAKATHDLRSLEAA